MPRDIQDNVLEDTICRAFSLAGQDVLPEDLHACQQMLNSNRVIVKFKDRKLEYNAQIKRKNLHEKSFKFLRLKYSGKLFVYTNFCI